MPIVDGKIISPDEALARHRCPECGADFKTVSAQGHRQRHWRSQPPNGPDGDEGRRRMKLYDEYLAVQARKAILLTQQQQETPTPAGDSGQGASRP